MCVISGANWGSAENVNVHKYMKREKISFDSEQQEPRMRGVVTAPRFYLLPLLLWLLPESQVSHLQDALVLQLHTNTRARSHTHTHTHRRRVNDEKWDEKYALLAGLLGEMEKGKGSWLVLLVLLFLLLFLLFI